MGFNSPYLIPAMKQIGQKFSLAFVKLALHRYYSVAKAAIRKYDKNT